MIIIFFSLKKNKVKDFFPEKEYFLRRKLESFLAK